MHTNEKYASWCERKKIDLKFQTTCRAHLQDVASEQPPMQGHDFTVEPANGWWEAAFAPLQGNPAILGRNTARQRGLRGKY
ncbi:MAG TPA: hypothetical protein VN229_01260 [Terriglobales bacterium]|nr:hypothetical protein [Terriglobales bacterium]